MAENISDEQNTIKFSLPKKILHCLFIYYMGQCVYVWQHLCEGQGAVFQNEFSPFTVWVLGTELRLRAMAARVFIHWAISLSQERNFYDYKSQASNIWRHAPSVSTTAEMTMNHWGSWGRGSAVYLRSQNEFQISMIWRMRLCFKGKNLTMSHNKGAYKHKMF